MTDDQSPDTGPKSGEGLESDELFMQPFERLAAGPHPSQRPPTRIIPEMYRASGIPTKINSMIE